MFKSLAAATVLACANAWDMPQQLNGIIEPATWTSYLGGDALKNVGDTVG